MHTLLQSPIQPDFDTATDIKRLTECDFAFPGSDRHIHATAGYCESRSVCEENEVNGRRIKPPQQFVKEISHFASNISAEKYKSRLCMNKVIANITV